MQFHNGTEVCPSAECFDLIDGTGTGRISAFFLGHMRMMVDEAIKEYMSLDLAKTAFKPSSTSLFHILPVPRQAILDGSTLDHSIGDIANWYLHDHNALLNESSTDPGISWCRTAVLATSSASADSPPHVFQSYGMT